MSIKTPVSQIQADEMRRLFDESFALPFAQESASLTDYLLITAGGARWALPVGKLSGLASRRKVVHLPGDEPSLLGLAGVNGQLTAVFCLARLLGQAAAAEAAWVAICGTDQSICLAFESLEGHVRIAQEEVSLADQSGSLPPHVRQVLPLGAENLYVLDVASIVAEIGRLMGSLA